VRATVELDNGHTTWLLVAGLMEAKMNSMLEYILVGIVTLAVLVYLVIALLAPERF
jgi:hypothetical protein